MWIAFQCWAVWYAAKVTFLLIYAGVGGAFSDQVATVIDVAALVPAFAWYIWRYYTPRRADQIARGVQPSDGGLQKWWRNLSDGTRVNIYLAASIVVIFTLTHAANCSVRGTACYRAVNYNAVPDFDSLPNADTGERIKNAVR
jgi:hypothetical protein